MEKVYLSFDVCLRPPSVGLLQLGLGQQTPRTTVYGHSERNFSAWALKSGGFSTISKCGTCGGEGRVECPGCKGTKKYKKKGNVMKLKCFDCQGLGFKSCPICGKGGLTPEQKGER